MKIWESKFIPVSFKITRS